MEKERKYFQKVSRNLTCYLISFISYNDFKELMLVNHTFVESIRFYIKNTIEKNKKLFQFYKKHIFLFNRDCSILLKRSIFPYIKDSIGLKKLLANRSAVLKNFLAEVEQLILTDSSLYGFNEYEKIFFDSLRKDVLIYLAKVVVRSFKNLGVFEVYLDKSEIGALGAEFVGIVIKFSKEIYYLDLSFSKLDDSELRDILNIVEMIDRRFKLNLKGVELKLPLLKIITNIKKNDLTKEIFITENRLLNVSKSTRPKYIKYK
jgi:hypothetical protein